MLSQREIDQAKMEAYFKKMEESKKEIESRDRSWIYYSVPEITSEFYEKNLLENFHRNL